MNHPHRYKMRFAMPVFAVLAALALGAIVRFLWNAILPALLNVNPISYWQSVGLLVLCRILFGNFGGSKGGGPRRWGNWEKFKDNDFGDQPFGPQWRNKWREMSAEDRIKFRQQMRNRCGKPPEDE
ncbi:hypothetical protein [Dyadobacter pollutisoli]|uniref:DUF1682 domain-containing protein n=1 Tax=Dyadobacter pollutisoli TaxID=2910158 RepID=A0A9E8N5R9_9BACT|nr:hypothetical protein [Dyadobacter pollutisoli]WAC09803.1 hypothetical protein ON006_18820 [Dyadobacter pollutisoli]